MSPKMKGELPVDTGWAWVICAAVFANHYLISNSFQVLAVTLLDLTEQFDTSLTNVSLILMVKTLCISITSIVSVNFLVPRFGLREVLSVSAVVFSLCGIGYAFTSSVEMFIVLATIRGIAIGAISVPSVTLLGFYFKTHRSMATTIAVCGASVSAISWPRLTRYIMSVYDLQGTLLLNGAVDGHLILTALLLRPVTSYSVKHIIPPEQIPSTTTTTNNVKNQDCNCNEDKTDRYQRKPNTTTVLPMEQTSRCPNCKPLLEGYYEEKKNVVVKQRMINSNSNEKSINIKDSNGTKILQNNLQGDEKGDNLCSSSVHSHHELSKDGKGDNLCSSSVHSNHELSIQTATQNQNQLNNSYDESPHSCQNNSDLLDKDKTYDALACHKSQGGGDVFELRPEYGTLLGRSVDNIYVNGHRVRQQTPQDTNNILHVANVSCSNCDRIRTPSHSHNKSSSTSCLDKMPERQTKLYPSVWTLGSTLNLDVLAASTHDVLAASTHDVLSGAADDKTVTFWKKVQLMFDLSLFKEWAFLWMLLAAYPCGTNSFIFTYLPTMATLKGVSKDDGALMLSILGALDLTSRMIVALIADTKKFKITSIIGFSCICLGSIFLFVEFYHDLVSLIAMSIALGLFVGIRSSLITVMFIEVFGLERMSKSFSLFSVFITVSVAGHSPLLSHMMEELSVNAVMYYIGCSMVFGGVLIYSLPLVIRMEKAWKKS